MRRPPIDLRCDMQCTKAKNAASREGRGVGGTTEAYQVGNSWIPIGSQLMPHYDLELIQVMRSALEDVMTRVPSEHSTPTTKVHLAEIILRAAAQGKTSYDELVAAAINQMQVAISRT